MLTLNQTSGNNNQIIWVLKINTPTPIYLSTRDITLDAVNYDGQVLNFDNYLTDITQTSTIQSSGGTGAVSSFGFSVSRYVDNAAFNSFFNEFYPATSGVYLSGVLVQLGLVWQGATTEAEITWLMVGRIVDYQYEQRKLNITVFQESEITNKEVPFYAVQKDFDNGVSYFENAPDDSLGKTLPIVYGDLNQSESLPPYVRRFMPTVRVDEKKYVISTHENYNSYGGSTDDRLFEEIPEL